VLDFQERTVGMQGIGIGIAMSRPCAVRAEPLMHAGRLEEALIALRSGFEFVVEKREGWRESELPNGERSLMSLE
jgi:hypothetical protein